MNSPQVQNPQKATLIGESLATFVAEFEYARLPDAVRERAKLLMLDAIGIAFRAAARQSHCTRKNSPATDRGRP